MNNSDKNTIIERYRARLNKFGPSIESLASGTIERRNIRFDLLSKVGDMNGSKILDIGSGLGDYYAYLKDKGIVVEYTGYDLSPDLVALASERFPDAKFEVRDIQTEGIPQEFDYIVSSQTFNFKFTNEDNIELAQTCLKLCYEHCSKGLCFDFLTSYVDFKEDHLFYYSPEEMFAYAKSLTKRVSLSHESKLYEFAIFLYRDFVGWNNNVQ